MLSVTKRKKKVAAAVCVKTQLEKATGLR